MEHKTLLSQVSSFLLLWKIQTYTKLIEIVQWISIAPMTQIQQLIGDKAQG